MFYSQALALILAVFLKVHFSECKFRCKISEGDKQLNPHPFSALVVLNCSFYGAYVDAINWTRNGQPVEDEHIQADPQVNKMWSAVVLPNVTRQQDVGSRFKCVAKHGQEETSCSAVPSKPKLRKLERVKIVKDGRNVDVICRAENVWPLPLATWWRKGSLVRHGDYHDSFILLRPTDNMLTMRIFGTEGYHHGTYTCVAKNMFGTATEEVNIMVQRYNLIQDDKRSTVALEGRNVTLECICNKEECKEKSAEAYWKFRGSYVNQSENIRLSKMVTNSSAKIMMTIANASQINEGEYTCGINTSLGFQEKQRQLHVLTKETSPRIIAPSKEVSANLHSPAWLKCDAIYPAFLKEPEPKIFWTFNDTLIAKDSQHFQQNIHIPREGPNSTINQAFQLHIANVTLRDFGWYSCGVKFKVGVFKTNISFFLKEKQDGNKGDGKDSGSGSKESPLIAISSITAGGIIMGFVVALVAYRLCRKKRNTEEPFFDAPEIGHDFRYDVFVTFSNQDLNWVKKELIPLVEKHKLNYCVHDRDFEVGKPVVDNMAQSVYTSRKVLAVMSQNYMSSKFCRGELEMALYRSTEMGDSSVIVMRIDGVDRNKLPKALRNRTFLDYNDYTERKNWEARLIKHLKPPEIEKCTEKNSEKLDTLLKDYEV